jgi:hypothetical protein
MLVVTLEPRVTAGVTIVDEIAVRKERYKKSLDSNRNAVEIGGTPSLE